METITIDGREYRVTIEPEVAVNAPWDEECGHGPVSDWTGRPKKPGELVLNQDRGAYRYYDFAEACRIAKRDGWGWIPEPIRIEAPIGYRLPTYRCGDFRIVSDDANEAYAAIYAHFRESMGAKEYAARAARADFERLRDWCDGRWHYVGVVVSDADDDSTGLWGIESDADAYLEEVARELAEDLHENWKARRQRECLMAYEG